MAPRPEAIRRLMSGGGILWRSLSRLDRATLTFGSADAFSVAASNVAFFR
jgi:hypothetical protein